MFRVIAAFSCLCALLLVATCSLSSHRPEVIVTAKLELRDPVSSSRVNPPLDGMGCYLVMFKAPGLDDYSNADTGGISHSCLRLAGRGTALVDYATMKSGVPLTLPLGSYSIEIVGLYRAGANCAGKTLRDFFLEGTPDVFSLATKASTSFTGATSLSLPATYDVGTSVNLSSSCVSSISSWKFVDGNGNSGLNSNIGERAEASRLVAHNSKLYLIWQEETSGSVSQIRARVFNGLDNSPAWPSVDGGGTFGINYNTGTQATQVDAISHAGTLYAVWREPPAGATLIRAKQYNNNDSSPAWTTADGNSASGLNMDPTRSASDPSLAINETKLYVAWSEGNQSGQANIRVKVHQGGGLWDFVDGAGPNGLNYDTGSAASKPALISFNGKLYLFWEELAPVLQIRARVYNGDDFAPGWAWVDGGGPTGLNVSPSFAASQVVATVNAGKLYLSWREINGIGRTQTRVKVYNGNDLGPVWTAVDGGGGPGLNRAPGENAHLPRLIPFGTNLYAAWSEENPMGIANVRASLYNGDDGLPSWTATDGLSSDGLNKVPTYDAFNVRSATFDSKLYLTWDEDNASSKQIRVVVGE